MPVVSKKQNAWAHTPAGVKALGGPAKLKEWEVSGPAFRALPERVGEKKKSTKQLRHTARPR